MSALHKEWDPFWLTPEQLLGLVVLRGLEGDSTSQHVLESWHGGEAHGYCLTPFFAF